MQEEGISQEILLVVLKEIEEEYNNNGISKQDKAFLLHGAGAIYGLLGETEKQKNAWQRALELAPDNDMIKESLKSLK